MGAKGVLSAPGVTALRCRWAMAAGAPRALSSVRFGAAEQSLHKSVQDVEVKWLADHGIRTGSITGPGVRRAHQHDGNVSGSRVGLERLTQLHAADQRHHDVGDDQI